MPPRALLRRLFDAAVASAQPDLEGGVEAIRNVVKVLKPTPGVYRMLDAFAKVGARVSVAVNGAIAERYPQIVADIRAGFAKPEQVEFIHGRGQAIAQLIAAAKAGDVVVLAGKGHEDYQEVGGVKKPFSDLAQAAEGLTKRREAAGVRA